MTEALDLKTRILRLRKRLRTPESAVVTSATQGLENRLEALRRKIPRRQTGSTTADVQLLDQIRTIESPTANGSENRDARPGTIQSVGSLLSRFEEQRATIETWRDRGVFAEGAALLHGSEARSIRKLLDQALALIRSSANSGSDAAAFSNLLETIDRHVTQRMASIRPHADRRMRRLAQIEQLRDLFLMVAQGARPRLSELEELANGIIIDVDRDHYPILDFRAQLDPALMVAAHALNVAHLSAYLAAADIAWRAHRTSIVVAALVQDIGMLAGAEPPASAELAAAMLLHEGELTRQQRAEMERHPIFATMFLEQIGLDVAFADAAGAHHERLDGSGYPQALSAAAVSPTARLLAVADAYVGRRAARAHRPAQSAKTTLTEMLAEAEAGKFDNQWAIGLLQISLYPVGSIVELSSGEIAEVVAPQQTGADPNLAMLPIVRVFLDRSGASPNVSSYWNLAQRPDCRIVRQLADIEAAELVAQNERAA